MMTLVRRLAFTWPFNKYTPPMLEKSPRAGSSQHRELDLRNSGLVLKALPLPAQPCQPAICQTHSGPAKCQASARPALPFLPTAWPLRRGRSAVGGPAQSPCSLLLHRLQPCTAAQVVTFSCYVLPKREVALALQSSTLHLFSST